MCGPCGSQVWKVEWNVTGTVLSSSGDDGKVRLWKGACGPMRRLGAKARADLRAEGTRVTRIQPTCKTSGRASPSSTPARPLPPPNASRPFSSVQLLNLPILGVAQPP